MVENKALKDYLYNTFPEIYRQEDLNNELALKRYLNCIVDGGLQYIADKSNVFTDLIDIDKCTEKEFKVLYASLGLTYYPDIPIIYHKQFLKNYGNILRYLGAQSLVEYIVPILTGRTKYEPRYEYKRENGKRFFTILLPYDPAELGEGIKIEVIVKNIQPFIEELLPSYITCKFMAIYITPVEIIPDSPTISSSGCLSFSKTTQLPLLNTQPKPILGEFRVGETVLGG